MIFIMNFQSKLWKFIKSSTFHYWKNNFKLHVFLHVHLFLINGSDRVSLQERTFMNFCEITIPRIYQTQKFQIVNGAHWYEIITRYLIKIRFPKLWALRISNFTKIPKHPFHLGPSCNKTLSDQWIGKSFITGNDAYEFLITLLSPLEIRS